MYSIYIKFLGDRCTTYGLTNEKVKNFPLWKEILLKLGVDEKVQRKNPPLTYFHPPASHTKDERFRSSNLLGFPTVLI